MQQFELSEELVSQIEGLIKADNKEDVSKLVEPLHSADIAEIIKAMVYLKEHPEIKHGKIRVVLKTEE